MNHIIKLSKLTYTHIKREREREREWHSSIWTSNPSALSRTHMNGKHTHTQRVQRANAHTYIHTRHQQLLQFYLIMANLSSVCSFLSCASSVSFPLAFFCLLRFSWYLMISITNAKASPIVHAQKDSLFHFLSSPVIANPTHTGRGKFREKNKCVHQSNGWDLRSASLGVFSWEKKKDMRPIPGTILYFMAHERLLNKK